MEETVLRAVKELRLPVFVPRLEEIKEGIAVHADLNQKSSKAAIHTGIQKFYRVLYADKNCRQSRILLYGKEGLLGKVCPKFGLNEDRTGYADPEALSKFIEICFTFDIPYYTN